MNRLFIEDNAEPLRFRLNHPRWGPSQIGLQRYGLWLIAIAAQLLTVLITWELWEIRTDPPNLPLFDVPDWAFGLPVVISLIFCLLDPCKGLILHIAVVAIASIFDQFRMQPQFLANIFLMLAVVSGTGQRITRWFLAAMWLWAGLHKLLSPHWFAHASYFILAKSGLESETALQIQFPFALGVGLGEIAVGLAAIFRLRLAAVGCVLLHLSIFVLLIVIEWNYSVLPWNMATAVIGAWVLWSIAGQQSKSRTSIWPITLTEWAAAVLLLVMPAGFFAGWVDHGYANVLYSDFVPRGRITGADSFRDIRGWDPVHVPFPYERRTHRRFFERIAQPGDKLHVMDPRPLLDDQYFVLDDSRSAQSISRSEFFAAQEQSPAGIASYDRRSVFYLRQWGRILARPHGSGNGDDQVVFWAYEMKPEYLSAEALRLLKGLPNLEQLQLANCPVTDEHLKIVGQLDRLAGLGLNNTSVTDAGLQHLQSLRRLQTLEVENTRVSAQGRAKLENLLRSTNSL